MSHQRLNDHRFKFDLMSFLALSHGARGSYAREVEDWIKEYDLQIIKNFEKLLNEVKNLFPKQYVTITPSPDDSASYIINIYGCGIEEIKKESYDDINKITKEYCDDGELFLIHKVSVGCTINYYPEETRELIKMGTLTEEEVFEVSERKRISEISK